MRIMSAEEAVASVGDGHTIFIHGGAATPTALLAALAARAVELTGVTTVGLHLEGPCPERARSLIAIAHPDFRDELRLAARQLHLEQ